MNRKRKNDYPIIGSDARLGQTTRAPGRTPAANAKPHQSNHSRPTIPSLAEERPVDAGSVSSPAPGAATRMGPLPVPSFGVGVARTVFTKPSVFSPWSSSLFYRTSVSPPSVSPRVYVHGPPQPPPGFGPLPAGVSPINTLPGSLTATRSVGANRRRRRRACIRRPLSTGDSGPGSRFTVCPTSRQV